MGIGHRSLGHATKGLAGLVLGSFFGVGGNIEGDEQNKVRSEDANAGKGSELLARAFAGIGPRRVVGRNEVGVGGKVDESCEMLGNATQQCLYSNRRTEVNDELDDLQTSDPFLPPAADTTGALEVVPVHDHVDKQVQRNDNPRHSGATKELGVAQDSGSAMVVAVEESCKQIGSVH